MATSKAESSSPPGLQQEPVLTPSSSTADGPSNMPHENAGDANETAMQDAGLWEVSPTTSDDENMSSEDNYTDDEAMGEMDVDAPENGRFPLTRCEDLGDMIIQAFTDTVQYEDDEARDIFDDGLENDDSDSDSDVSTNFEELSAPDITTRVVRLTPELEDIETSDAYESTSSSGSDDEDEKAIAPKDKNQGASEAESNEGVHYTIVPGPTEVPALPRKSFAELQTERYTLLFQKAKHRLLELEEVKKHLEQQISLAQENIKIAEEDKQAAEDEVCASLEHSGLSQELYDLYLSFCESLDPKFGQRGGFSVTCNANHKGSYVDYDPEFGIFNECIEMPYANCNFRCEASVVVTNEKALWRLVDINAALEPTRGEEVHKTEYIVEFWPIESPEPLTGSESTLGDQYPDLYELANAAVRAGSEAAMKMLIALPDMNSYMNGGWLFDYRFEEALSDNPIIGKRWRFRSAHKIDKPCTVEEKRKRLNVMLAPENIR